MAGASSRWGRERHQAPLRGAKSSVPFSVEDVERHIDANCVRVARQLRHSARRVLGLLPSSNDVATWPLAIQLGVVLKQLCKHPIALVDPDLSWPDLLRSEEVPDESAGEGWFINPRQLAPSLLLVAPNRSAPLGAKVPVLQIILHELLDGPSQFAHIIVDLTGFQDRMGEFLSALDQMDGIIVVARAGSTRRKDVERVERGLPTGTNLGVLLVE